MTRVDLLLSFLRILSFLTVCICMPYMSIEWIYHKQSPECVLWRRLFLKKFQSSQENACVGQVFRPATLLKWDSNTGIFSWNLQIFKKTYSEKYLLTAISDLHSQVAWRSSNLLSRTSGIPKTEKPATNFNPFNHFFFVSYQVLCMVNSQMASLANSLGIRLRSD